MSERHGFTITLTAVLFVIIVAVGLGRINSSLETHTGEYFTEESKKCE